MASDSLRRNRIKALALPVRHDWLVRERAYGKIAMEPFEPGFALTAGNAYRRVLLSSIASAAPTWVVTIRFWLNNIGEPGDFGPGDTLEYLVRDLIESEGILGLATS
jgi:hypothetical protein